MIHIVMAQIIDNVQTKSTIGFADVLANLLRSKYKIEVTRLSTPTEISNKKPLLVICQNYSRIATDITTAAKDVGGIPDHLVVIVIIHVTAEHALPTMKSADVIVDAICRKYGLLVDFGYLDGHLHDCEMNTLGEHSLVGFLNEHTSKATTREKDCKTAKRPCIDTPTRQDGLKKYGVQFYSELEFNSAFGDLIKTCVDVQAESSLTNLRKGNMWVVVCHADSKSVRQVRQVCEGDSMNAKIFVLIDPEINDSEKVSKKGDNILEIRLQKESLLDDRQLLGILEDVVRFIQTYIDNNVSKLFEKGNKRIEAYTDDKKIQEEINENLGITASVVQSLVEFTNHDPRILWIMVCEKDTTSEKAFKDASSQNAKMILILDESIPEDKIHFDTKDVLLIGRLRRSSLALDADNIQQMKRQLTDIMTHVQTRLMKEPFQKLFSELDNAKCTCCIF